MDLADARAAAQPWCALRPRRARTAPRPPTASCPGPSTTPSSPPRCTPADRSTYVIQTSYHTAVAGAILAAALLRRTTATRRPGRATHRPRPDPPTPLDPSRSSARRRPVGRRAAAAAPLRAGGLHRARARCRAAHRRRPARPRTGARRRRVGGRPRAGRTCRRCGRARPLLARVARVAAAAGHRSPAEPARGPLRSAQLEVAVVDPAQPGDQHVVHVALHHPPRLVAAPGAAAGARPAARSPRSGRAAGRSPTSGSS